MGIIGEKTRESGQAFKIGKCLWDIFKAFGKLYKLNCQLFFLQSWLILLIYYSFRLFPVASSEFKKEQTCNKVSIMSCWIKCVFVQSEIEGFQASWSFQSDNPPPPLLADTCLFVTWSLIYLTQELKLY